MKSLIIDEEPAVIRGTRLSCRQRGSSVSQCLQSFPQALGGSQRLRTQSSDATKEASAGGCSPASPGSHLPRGVRVTVSCAAPSTVVPCVSEVHADGAHVFLENADRNGNNLFPK